MKKHMHQMNSSTHSTRQSSSSSSVCGTGCTSWSCLVERFERIRTATKGAKENMATTADSGNAHAGTMLDVFSGVAAIALASYIREGAVGAHGFAGAGSGTGTLCGTRGAAVVHGLAGAGTGTGTGACTTGAQGL